MDKNDIHEITLNDVNEFLNSSKNLSKSKAEGQEFLEGLQSDSFNKKINAAKANLAETAEKYKEDINVLTEVAQNGLLQIDEVEKKEPRHNPYLSKEKEPIKIPKFDFVYYKSQISVFGVKMSVGIKPIVSNVRKIVKVAKNHIAISAAAMGVVGGLTLGVGASAAISNVIENIQEDNLLKEAMENYKNTIYFSNRSDGKLQEDKNGHMQPVYNYNMQSMITSLHEKYEDPLMTWYFYYETFMKYGEEYTWSNNEKQILGTYNAFYGTNYKDMNDFLEKNGFKNMADYKEYVTLQEEAHRERGARSDRS